MNRHPIFAEDLAGVFSQLEPSWSALKNARLFLTGATGFIGRWMLEALRDANDTLGLGLSATILTRDPARFARSYPELANYAPFRFVSGDVQTLVHDGEAYSHVIHAATDASADLNENDPLKMFNTVFEGTRRVLDFALTAKADRFFFLSSGAVYGAQPWSMARVDESYMGGPDLFTHRSAYGEGKRAAEMLCTIYAKQFGLDIVNARIFAVLGPMLSLDIHFAAGNFIRNAMAGEKVTVISDGRAERSYLYAADLTTWLWSILLRAPDGATYNVGSEDAISIGSLAERTATLLGSAGFAVLGEVDPGWNPGRYVPSTAKIRTELGVTMTVGLDDAIRRTAAWNGWKND